MNQFIRTATFEDGCRLIRELRIEDRRELEGMGHPILHIPYGILVSNHATLFHDKNGAMAGIAGIVELEPGIGQIWMLCTSVVETAPHTFIRNAKRWLREVEKEYTLLWNFADARNHYHHKLLRLLGFQALRIVPIGPDNLPYFEIVKLCASYQQP